MIRLSSSIASFTVVLLLFVGCGNGSTGSSRKTTSASTARVASTDAPPPQKGPISKVEESLAKTKHVVVARLPHFGVVLVTGMGYTLYAFVPEKHGETACTGSCASVWPTFQVPRGNSLDTSPDLSVPLITVERDPAGGRMVRYAGWLLHRYVGDTTPGMTSGQGLHSNGGHWYLISHSGNLVRRTP
jgi:predicted lipoprotein with Yx(FWY)xxD motif